MRRFDGCWAEDNEIKTISLKDVTCLRRDRGNSQISGEVSFVFYFFNTAQTLNIVVVESTAFFQFFDVSSKEYTCLFACNTIELQRNAVV